MNIYKEVTGDGEDLVILHGWGCNHLHMRPVVDLLAEKYRVTNIDLPGRGDSDWVPSIETIYDIADVLIDELPDKAIYIGWSFGGLISISIAAKFPDRIKKFIGVTTTPRFLEDDKWPGVAKPGFIAGIESLNTLEKFNKYFMNFYDNEFSEFKRKPGVYQELVEILNNSKAGDYDVLVKGVKICDFTDLRKEFKNLKCPVELILGDKDDAVDINSISAIKELNPNININVIAGAKHMPFWTHQKQFNELLSKILL